jgi:hypothetical protein
MSPFDPNQKKGYSGGRVGGDGIGRWPVTGSEELRWVGRLAESGAQTYQSAGPPDIRDLDLNLSSETTALAEVASAALARFDSENGVEVLPFASLFLRAEAAASSRIENLRASARSNLIAELGVTSEPDASVIAANTRAMLSALELADELTPTTVLTTHYALMDGDPVHGSGVWRQELVWIGSSGLSPTGATFIAPDSIRVPVLMDDVMAFARRDDLPRLAQAAVVHAQFETIPHSPTATAGPAGHSFKRCSEVRSSPAT